MKQTTDMKQQQTPPVQVAACDALPAAGTWQEITPPEVKAGFGMQTDYGSFAFTVDPIHSGTVYLGTARQKVWKTTDCGATWAHIDTGRNGDVLDPGMNWTFAVDPTDSNVLYTNAGYGGKGLNGLYKSVNAGVDWDPVWPPDDAKLAGAVQYNFANVVAMDPGDHLHLLLTFHAECTPPYNDTCIAESYDGGANWTLQSGQATWSGAEGQVIYFLNGPKNWLWASQANGFWSTTDGGANWTRAFGGDDDESHLQGAQLLHAPDGSFYVAGTHGVWHSADGSPGSWEMLDNTGPIAGGIVTDGTNLYSAMCYFPGFCNPPGQVFRTAKLSDPKTWTTMDSPALSSGGSLGYDPSHHLLYSSNLGDGFWRVVLP
jgi:photosystem II stability/assembly factor-like uncharacterized protein